MPITRRNDLERNFVDVEWMGEITIEVLKNHVVALLDDPFAFSCGRDLTDGRQAVFKFTGSDLHKLIQETILPRLKGKRWKSALVVRTDDQYGSARQYNFMAEAYSTDAIFYDRESALAWLLDSP